VKPKICTFSGVHQPVVGLLLRALRLFLRGVAGERQEHLVQAGAAERQLAGQHAGVIEAPDHGGKHFGGCHRCGDRAVSHFRRRLRDPGHHLDDDGEVGRIDRLDGQRKRADLRFQLVGRAGGDHPAVVDYRDLVGEQVGFFQVLRGQQHGHAAADEASDDVVHVVAAARIESRGRLVEEQDLRTAHQARGQVQATAHASGVRLDGPVTGIGEPSGHLPARRRQLQHRRHRSAG
jgi:hypothetical protein